MEEEKYTLMHISTGGETEIERFEAPTTEAACRRHIEAWNKKKGPHAIALVLPCGLRHSYRDSIEYLAVT